MAEYSTVWLSFNSFYLLPWPEDLGLSPGLCLSRRYPCAAVPGHPAFASSGGISTYWAVGLMGASFKIWINHIRCLPTMLYRSLLSPTALQFSSVAQSYRKLCDPMNLSTPGLRVHHQLPEFTQTHVHRVGDAIQPSHPLSSPSPSALSPSQHQGLFQWVNSSHEVAKVLEFQL